MRLYCLLALLGSLSCSVLGSEPLRVEQFVPEGSTKEVRQARARFSEAMVRFGDPRLADPFEIHCPVSGTGRWVDDRNWVYDFADVLPGGLRCEFRPKPKLLSLGGAAMVESPVYGFDTGGPAVEETLPSEGSGRIDENQSFLLRLNAGATPESIVAAAHCEIEGLGEQIEVERIAGEGRAALLSPALRARSPWFFGEASAPPPDESRLIALKCRRSLPPDHDVRLVWGRAITSPGGISRNEDQVLAYHTRPAFAASFQCERVNAKAQCLPIQPMVLTFSAPVPTAQVASVRLVDEGGKRFPAEPVDGSKIPFVEKISFPGPFPEQSRFRIELPPELRDDAGRPLENAAQFPLEVRTDEYPPLAKFSGEFGILEWQEGGVLPVSLRNVEAPLPAQRVPAAPLDGKLRRLQEDDKAIISGLKKVKEAVQTRMESEPQADGTLRWRNLTGSTSIFAAGETPESFALARPGAAKDFELVGIPLKDPGFYLVELASPRLGAALLGEAKTRYVPTAALVTDMAVHLKWGRESSLVWVTALHSAKPVPRARVRISDFCTGAQIWDGETGIDGTVKIGPGWLPAPNDARECSEWSEAHPLFVSARTDRDLSFTVSAWNQGILPDDFQLPAGSAQQARVTHTVFDRTLFRAGETVSMKHFLRLRTAEGFALPPGELPDKIEIRHSGSGDNYVLDVRFDPSGIAESAWAIPVEAKLGVYQVSYRKGDSWYGDGGSFQVEQFRIPTMKALIQPAAPFLVNAREASVDLFVSYLSGGGASGAPVKLRTQIQSRSVEFPGYGDYSFGGPEVREGLSEEGEDESGEEGSAPAQVLPLSLDKAGAARATIPHLPELAGPKDLVAELEFQDANGERSTVARRIPLWPAALSLGVRPEGWAASREQLRFRVVALDLSGKPVAGRPIKVELFAKTTYSYRKRMIGGFYAYEDQTERKRLDTTCEGRSDAQGLLSCELKPGVSGDVILRASAADGQGNTALASREVWVAGGEDWWFSTGPSDRMDLLPEARAYESGQSARFQVKMPFREATALVTVEREGVLESFVTALSGKEPVIEVPIKANYAPNVFVSALVLRGRQEETFPWLKNLGRRLGVLPQDRAITALVDLHKPAYRLGMAQIEVGWKPYRLEVEVKPERETYKVREQAHLKVSVRRADGGALPADAEIALAAVDEGLLELKPNDSWKLLDRMLGNRGIEVYTATAQMQVVGKRHYGRKAIPHGGGGGRQSARELFDTLLVWRGRVPLNGQGVAELDLPLNDSLTAFRLVAVAHGASGFFGTGQASLRTTQDLMIHGGLPPLVREEDDFKALFTIRNASDRPLKIKARAAVDTGLTPPAPRPEAPAVPDQAPKPSGQELPAMDLDLAAGEARELSWPFKVPLDAKQLLWELQAEAADGSARDRVKFSQQVIPALPVRVYQATLARLEKPLEMSVARPEGAVPGRGGIRVSLRARLGDGLGGVTDYMAHYPYSCMEQRVSRAIALGDDTQWTAILRDLPAFLDGDGLLKYFASDYLRGSDVLTAYVLAIAQEAGRTIPDEPRRRMLDALKAFAEGRLSRASAVPAADLSLRRLAAIGALARYGEASPKLLESLSIEPARWPTSAVLDWLGILQRVKDLPNGPARSKEAQQILRGRLNFQGTVMGFSTESSDALWWLMVSPDENAVRAVSLLQDLPEWRADLPRLVNGTLARLRRGHWSTTPANAWGVLAMEKFSRTFEAVSVSGYTEAELGGLKKGMEWSESTRQSALNLPWTEEPATLRLKHAGQGAPWAIVQSRAALPLKQSLFSGYTIKRTVTPVEQKQPGTWSRGDVLRVHLDLEAQSDMSWVVVDDPVPAGASILGGGLGRDSAILSGGEKTAGETWPVFEERRFEGFRAYFDYVPRGAWSVEYTLRLNNPGRFELPASRVEALYAPEMFGESPNGPVEVGDGP